MKRQLWSVFLVLVAVTFAFGDAGVLVPRDKQQPDPAVLSLEEMEITVRIDNGDARVFVRQVLPTIRPPLKKAITSLHCPAMQRFPTLQPGMDRFAYRR